MFTPREAMAYKGQLPEQRNPKLPPDLLNLLAIQSAMRAKKDAENQLAAALGNPNQPTVADALKQQATQALQSSQEPSDQGGEQSQPEKMGLAALAAKNQGVPPQVAQQAPQGAPQAPQAPQGAPKMMAAGGLASARSNLPSNYQTGGIVAFRNGGETEGDADESSRPVMSYGEQMSNLGGALVDSFKTLVSVPGYGLNREAAKPGVRPADKVTSSSAAGMAGYVPPKRFVDPDAIPSGAMDEVTAERLRILNREMQKAQMAANDPASTPEMKGRAAGDVAALTREIALVSKNSKFKAPAISPGGLGDTQPAQAAQAPQVAQAAKTEPSAVSEFVTRSLEEGAPEEAGTAAGKRSEEAYAASDAAILKQQQDYLAKKLALQESAKASRPDDFSTFLNLIGKNANRPRGQEFAGVSEGMSASKAAQQAQEMKNLDEINGLQVAMEQAKASGNIRKYLASEKALEKAIASQPSIATTGASLENVLEQTQERRDRVNAQIAAKAALAAQVAVDKGVATQAQVARIVSDVTKNVEGKIMMNPEWQAAQKAKNTALMDKILDDEVTKGVSRILKMENQFYSGNSPASTIPAEAAAALKANPSLAAQFNQKYGAGASAAILGR